MNYFNGDRLTCWYPAYTLHHLNITDPLRSVCAAHDKAIHKYRERGFSTVGGNSVAAKWLGFSVPAKVGLPEHCNLALQSCGSQIVGGGHSNHNHSIAVAEQSPHGACSIDSLKEALTLYIHFNNFSIQMLILHFYLPYCEIESFMLPLSPTLSVLSCPPPLKQHEWLHCILESLEVV